MWELYLEQPYPGTCQVQRQWHQKNSTYTHRVYDAPCVSLDYIKFVLLLFRLKGWKTSKLSEVKR